MFDQCEVYFGMKEGKLADTAFVPAEGPPSVNEREGRVRQGRVREEGDMSVTPFRATRKSFPPPAERPSSDMPLGVEGFRYRISSRRRGCAISMMYSARICRPARPTSPPRTRPTEVPGRRA